MIQFDQFVRLYTGKKCTHPNGISGQCVCLYRCYLDEVLGVPQTDPVVGAKDLWVKADPKYFLKTPNSPLAVPVKGDIMIWPAWLGNPSGHVGMVIDANVWSFRSFDSNWSVPKIANVERHSYRNPAKVIGWLRRK